MVRSQILRLAAVTALSWAALGFVSWSPSGTVSPAATRASEAADTTSLSIKILNDHADAGTFVLFIELVGGVRQSLGTVRAGTSVSFNFAATRGSSYVLVQQTDTGDTYTSNRFTCTQPTAVTWDMNTRRLTVQRR
jgi:hypothetical protein